MIILLFLPMNTLTTYDKSLTKAGKTFSSYISDIIRYTIYGLFYVSFRIFVAFT